MSDLMTEDELLAVTNAAAAAGKNAGLKPNHVLFVLTVCGDGRCAFKFENIATDRMQMEIPKLLRAFADRIEIGGVQFSEFRPG